MKITFPWDEDKLQTMYCVITIMLSRRFKMALLHDGWLNGLVWRVFIEVAGYPAFWSDPEL
jgi:hypothetical protein